jgi:dihydrodipicolinate reductase
MSAPFNAELTEDNLRTLVLQGLRGRMVEEITNEILREVNLNIKARIETQVREAVTKYTKSVVGIKNDFVSDRINIIINIS